MIKWMQTSRLSIKNSLSLHHLEEGTGAAGQFLGVEGCLRTAGGPTRPDRHIQDMALDAVLLLFFFNTLKPRAE